MYYPYFRGKQFELLTIRECAPTLAQCGFTPIIEPVRELRGLDKALREVRSAEGKAIVIVNPAHGQYSTNGEAITDLLKADFADYNPISAGILISEATTIAEVAELYGAHSEQSPSLVHAGFTDPKELAAWLKAENMEPDHVFSDRHTTKLYQRHFRDSHRVLLHDGFERRRNADHPAVEIFSELHVTYEDEGMQGFGDYLIVGDDFVEGGGPAYAVAIHLTYIDDTRDGQMFIRHIVSTTRNTPTDPAGKFQEALNELANLVASGNSKFYQTQAIEEFLDLHEKGHFPGLGYVKKLSMKHHIETLAQYFS